MTPDYVLVLLLGSLLVWVVTVLDILTRAGLTRVERALWLASVTVVFPTSLLWYLTRPVEQVRPRRLDHLLTEPAVDDRPDVMLVAAVVARTRGQISAEEYSSRLGQAFGGSPPQPRGS